MRPLLLWERKRLNKHRNAVKNNLIAFKLLEKEGAYDGVIGYFHRNNVLTTPILGYEIAKGHENGLYRLLSLLIADEVLEKDYLGHFSAGAGNFNYSMQEKWKWHNLYQGLVTGKWETSADNKSQIILKKFAVDFQYEDMVMYGRRERL
jgi:hypothetical protein